MDWVMEGSEYQRQVQMGRSNGGPMVGRREAGKALVKWNISRAFQDLGKEEYVYSSYRKKTDKILSLSLLKSFGYKHISFTIVSDDSTVTRYTQKFKVIKN